MFSLYPTKLATAIAEYTVPPELTLVNVGVSPTAHLPGGQSFTLSPPSEREKEEDEIWDTGLSKARNRLIGILFCLVFNLDPGTPTIYAYFIFSILYRINTRSSRLHQPSSISRPPMAHIQSSRRARPISDSYLFDLRRGSAAGVGDDFPQRSLSKNSVVRSMDLSSLSRIDSIIDRNNDTAQEQGSSIHAVVDMESFSPKQKSILTLN
ncbi:hypothetical protein BGX27_007789 [Mortierella sp. AM989]|nr:hypothetical protein BGX27_007789 [Mortierella sp. AM989]